MIEFKARLLVDSQDPEWAYNALKKALRNTGLEIRVYDTWLVNNEPLPVDSAQRIALAWKRKIGLPDNDHGVRFVTDDLAVMAELDQMDLFATANDIRNLAYLRAEEDEFEVDGNVGLIVVKGEDDV